MQTDINYHQKYVGLSLKVHSYTVEVPSLKGSKFLCVSNELQE